MTVPRHLAYFYEARPLKPGYRWMAFDLDNITPIGRDEARTVGAAEAAARACIEAHHRAEDGRIGSQVAGDSFQK